MICSTACSTLFPINKKNKADMSLVTSDNETLTNTDLWSDTIPDNLIEQENLLFTPIPDSLFTRDSPIGTIYPSLSESGKDDIEDMLNYELNSENKDPLLLQDILNWKTYNNILFNSSNHPIHLSDNEKSFTTLELKSNFISSAKKGFIIGQASAIHIGKSTHVWKVDVKRKADKRLIASFSCTQLILKISP